MLFGHASVMPKKVINLFYPGNHTKFLDAYLTLQTVKTTTFCWGKAMNYKVHQTRKTLPKCLHQL